MSDELEWDIGIFPWEELHNSKGTITVGIDRANGVDCTAVVFHKEDGDSYLVVLDEVIPGG